MVNDRLLQKVQAASGLGFSSFLALHLTNTISGHFGPKVYDMVQNIFRLYYQNPAVEVFMVFGTLAIHVGSSILRFQKRYQSTAFSTAFSASSSSSSTNVKKIRSKPVEPTESSSLNNVNSTETNGSNKLYDAEDEKKLRDCGPSFANLSFERQMHRLTGYILSLLVFGHLFVVRICPLIADKTIDMTFLTASVAVSGPIFVAYYIVLVTSGLFHGLFGLPLAFATLGYSKPSFLPTGKAIWKLSLPLSIILCSSVFAVTGYYFDIEIPKLHTDFRDIHNVYLQYLPESVVQLIGHY